METPLIRINQAGSADLVSVSEYYSHELVSYIRKVLHIIPETMFSLMSQIVHFQTNVIAEIPMRLDKEKFKEHAQLNDRMQVKKKIGLLVFYWAEIENLNPLRPWVCRGP